MPTYRANVKLLLAHMNLTVDEGEEFETVFPQVLVKGELVDMKLGDNLTLLSGPDAAADAEGKPAKRTPAPKD